MNRNFKKPIIYPTKLDEFRVRISQIPPLDVAFKSMALTDYEMLIAVVYRLNELIKINGEYIDLTNEVLEWVMEDGLTQAVLTQLISWKDDGTLDQLIDDLLFNSKLDKTEFNIFKDQLNTTLTQLETVFNGEIININTNIAVIENDVSDIKINITDIEDEIDEFNDEYQLFKTNVQALELKTSERLKDVAINIKEYEYLVDDGDWSFALQTALNESADEGAVIFIPHKIKISQTIKFPMSSISSNKLKSITILGNMKNLETGKLDGDSEGHSVIDFTGNGLLFDLTGDHSEVNSSVSFIDIALHGHDVVNSKAIEIHNARKTLMRNVLIRNFDSGITIKGYVYYSHFDLIKVLYSQTLGMLVQGVLSGSQISNCQFSKTSNGHGLDIQYGGNGFVITSCYFEQNTGAGVRLYSTEQVTLAHCYFEHNFENIYYSPRSNHAGAITVIGCGFSFDVDTDYFMRVQGDVHTTFIGNRITNNKGVENVLIRTVNGDNKLVAFGNIFRGFAFNRLQSETKQKLVLYNNTLNIDEVKLTGYLNFNRATDGDVTGTTPTKRVRVKDGEGNFIGWIQIYEG